MVVLAEGCWIGIEDRPEMLISNDLSTFLWSAGDGRGWTRASIVFDMTHTAETPTNLANRTGKKRDRAKPYPRDVSRPNPREKGGWKERMIGPTARRQVRVI